MYMYASLSLSLSLYLSLYLSIYLSLSIYIYIYICIYIYIYIYTYIHTRGPPGTTCYTPMFNVCAMLNLHRQNHMLLMCLCSKGILFRPWCLTNVPCGPLGIYKRGGRVLLTEILLPRIARRGAVCLMSIRRLA